MSKMFGTILLDTLTGTKASKIFNNEGSKLTTVTIVAASGTTGDIRVKRSPDQSSWSTFTVDTTVIGLKTFAGTETGEDLIFTLDLMTSSPFIKVDSTLSAGSVKVYVSVN